MEATNKATKEPTPILKGLTSHIKSELSEIDAMQTELRIKLEKIYGPVPSPFNEPVCDVPQSSTHVEELGDILDLVSAFKRHTTWMHAIVDRSV